MLFARVARHEGVNGNDAQASRAEEKTEHVAPITQR
jgi:hypothetical protein